MEHSGSVYDGTDRRKVQRDDELVRAVVVAVREEVAAQGIPDELHREHHAFMTAWISEQKRRQERSEKIKAQVGGWAIVTVLGAIGKGTWELWHLAQEHWK